MSPQQQSIIPSVVAACAKPSMLTFPVIIHETTLSLGVDTGAYVNLLRENSYLTLKKTLHNPFDFHPLDLHLCHVQGSILRVRGTLTLPMRSRTLLGFSILNNMSRKALRYILVLLSIDSLFFLSAMHFCSGFLLQTFGDPNPHLNPNLVIQLQLKTDHVCGLSSTAISSPGREKIFLSSVVSFNGCHYCFLELPRGGIARVSICSSCPYSPLIHTQSPSTSHHSSFSLSLSLSLSLRYFNTIILFHGRSSTPTPTTFTPLLSSHFLPFSAHDQII